jgi:hypothetical protein
MQTATQQVNTSSAVGWYLCDICHKSTFEPNNIGMFGTATILGALLVYLVTDLDQAKQAFLLALAIGTVRFVVKLTLHRRKWAKYVCLLYFLSDVAWTSSFVFLGTFEGFSRSCYGDGRTHS